LLDSLLPCETNIRLGLARLGVDDPGWIDSQLENCLNLSFGGTIEPSAQTCKKPEHLRVGVALDS